MTILGLAKQVFIDEISTLNVLKDSLDKNFELVVNTLFNCQGKIIITGIGKSGHIGKKISATLSSLGSPSIFLHPSEAQHGDLGVLDKNDIVIMISYSGESEEITNLLPNIKLIGSQIVAITGKSQSTLSINADFAILLPELKEADFLGLAPTSSTTATLVIGDAIAVCLAYMKNFTKKDFGLYHPAGSLGKKLLFKVKDCMYSGDMKPVAYSNDSMKELLLEMAYKGLGIVGILGNNNELIAAVTDGDLRRALESDLDIKSMKVTDIMSISPITIDSELLAVEALKIFDVKKVGALFVTDNKKNYIGVLKLQDVISKGISL